MCKLAIETNLEYSRYVYSCSDSGFCRQLSLAYDLFCAWETNLNVYEHHFLCFCCLLVFAGLLTVLILPVYFNK